MLRPSRETTSFARRLTPDRETLVVTVAGDLDLTNTAELRRATSPLYAVRCVVVDLTDVTHVDSSGLNVLVQATWELAKRGIPLRIVASPDGIVRRLFAVAHANELLAVFASLDDALAAPADEPES